MGLKLQIIETKIRVLLLLMELSVGFAETFADNSLKILILSFFAWGDCSVHQSSACINNRSNGDWIFEAWPKTSIKLRAFGVLMSKVVCMHHLLMTRFLWCFKHYLFLLYFTGSPKYCALSCFWLEETQIGAFLWNVIFFQMVPKIHFPGIWHVKLIKIMYSELLFRMLCKA